MEPVPGTTCSPWEDATAFLNQFLDWTATAMPMDRRDGGEEHREGQGHMVRLLLKIFASLLLLRCILILLSIYPKKPFYLTAMKFKLNRIFCYPKEIMNAG